MSAKVRTMPGLPRNPAVAHPLPLQATPALDGPFCGPLVPLGASQSIHGHIVFDDAGRVLHYTQRLNLLTGKGAIADRDLTALLDRLLSAMPDVHAALFREIGAVAARNSTKDTPVLTGMPSGRCLVDVDLARMQDGNWILTLAVRAEGKPGSSGIHTIANTDRLTGSANRVLFEKTVEASLREMANGSRASVTIVYLELDRFKAVSDAFGPAVGDLLLRAVRERLHTALRETDLLARLAGGLFGILLDGEANPLDIGDLSRRLIDMVRRPYRVDGQIINIGASVGVATGPADGKSSVELMRSADLALHHSRNAGQGTWNFFAPSMGERAQRRRMMELDLRKALAADQFEVHYQPQVEVETQSVLCMEALLRWRHPQQGLLLPGSFLPLAEEVGLAVPIGEWTLQTACKQATIWADHISVAVNVAPLHFESEGFVRSVEEALRMASLPAERLELEVTEQILTGDDDAIHSRLEQLNGLGVRVAIDGFGAGSASISQLVRFPFSKIKVDRSLVTSEHADMKSRAVLRAVSGLGNDLSMKMMAVGVETREHLAHVQADGYRSVQGFYYSDAVPADKVGTMLATFAQRGE